MMNPRSLPQRIKRRIYLLTPAISISLLCLFSFLPEGEWPDNITNALQQYASHFPQEKVYLHVDKDYYAAGESIWFKAYLTMQNLPNLTARNLYVELIAKDGSIVAKKMLGVQGGGAPGELVIPGTVKSGQYQLRAYTAWMLNFDTHFLFYKNITIFDQQAKTTATTPPASTDFAVQLFPEGGNLVTGAACQVAFKAIDAQGLPIDVTGQVKDSKGNNVAEIKTQHDGMGMFTLTPAPGENYSAIVNNAAGAMKMLFLPPAVTSGATLKVFNRGPRVFFQALTGPTTSDDYNEMLVVASMQQQLVYRALLNVQEGKISGFIPTSQLPSGILQITLFKKDGTPLAERLAFVKQPTMQLGLKEGTINQNRRTLNSFTIKVPDSLQAHISVSVTDADEVVENPDRQNIVSNFLLTSDLTGYIKDAGQYFENNEDSTNQRLDLVMMTNGWRRFAWKAILNNQFPKQRYEYETGINIGGTAYTSGGKLPMMGGQLDMIIKVPADSSSLYTKVPVTGLGEFAVDNAHFKDTAMIYYKGAGTKAFTDVTVKFTDHFFDYSVPVKTPYPYLLPPPIDNNVLKNFLATAAQGNRVNRNVPSMTAHPIQLKEVKVEEKKIKPEEELDKRYTSGMFSGGDGIVFDLTNQPAMYQNIFQYLQSRVAGLQITGDLNNPSISWRGGSPTFYLNEMPTDIQMLSTMNVSDIAMVKVFRPPFMGGFNGSNGAIAVYMKRGDSGKGSTPFNSTDGSFKDFAVFKKPGYALVREFYSPDYSVAAPLNSLPDQRLTLFWSPDVRIDPATHTATVSFYNNDYTKHFRVVAEGMSEDGNVGRAAKVF